VRFPFRPYHAHDERLWLSRASQVECLWSVANVLVLKKGIACRVDVQPRDGIHAAPYTHYHADYTSAPRTPSHGRRHGVRTVAPSVPAERK